MLDDLPKEFDVIVVGTGLVETILAGACARIGKNVLITDTNDFYGSDWASFTLTDLLKWLDSKDSPVESVAPQDDNEEIITIRNPVEAFQNRELKWHINRQSEDSTITIDMLEKQSRKFNIELAPKIYYSTGGLIDLLVQSNVARYCEFKLVSRILFERDGKLEPVPSSRADIFNSNDISLIDKRLLMKVMMNVSSLNIDDLHEDQNIPFIDYLKKQKLNSTLCHLIINSISMVDYTATTKEGIIRARRYLQSSGRYGNSPFLYQMYGSAEISQCFCRLCCVFGGISFLRFPLAGLTHDKTIGRCTGIVATTGERLRAKDAVICNHSYLSSVQSSARVLHRTILITNQSIKPSEKEEITYLRLSKPDETAIHLIEVGNAMSCAPPGFFLLYIFQENAQNSSTINTEQLIDRLLALTGNDFTRINILGRFTFDQLASESSPLVTSFSASNLIITAGPDGSIDHDNAVEMARKIFHQIYPDGEEFLPRAPDPEDIIIEDPNKTDEATHIQSNHDDSSKD